LDCRLKLLPHVWLLVRSVEKLRDMVIRGCAQTNLGTKSTIRLLRRHDRGKWRVRTQLLGRCFAFIGHHPGYAQWSAWKWPWSKCIRTLAGM